MDTSDNMDSFDESSTLPELSFDDLLDASPIKSNRKSMTEDEPLEFFGERKNRKDDTLNTPGPKKPPMLQKSIGSIKTITAGANTSSAAIRNNPAIKTGNNTIINVTKTNLNTSGGSGGPVLLNTKNVLPKTATQITKSSIKLTPKTTGGGTSNVLLSGKTAVRTTSGQIIYIHKTPTGASSTKPSGTSSTMIAKTQSNLAAGTSSGSKPMTIQVLRTADGNYVPIKTTTSGTNVKNTTVTLSPTNLAGKKIITSSGGQVFIKAPLKTTDTKATGGSTTITTNAITGVRTMVRPNTTTTTTTGQQGTPKSIFVQGSNGKQIIVSNQNIVKLSPKPQTSSTTTTSSSSGGNSYTTNTTSTGQMHAIQYPNKTGVQFVRVLPTSKVAGKSINSVTTTSASSSATATTQQATKTVTSSTNQPVKILNSSLPQKFTLIQKGGITTKLLVTQKKDVQKTLVTVPTLVSLNDDKNKSQIQQQQHQMLMKSQQQQSSSSSMHSVHNSSHPSLIRKHKISDINSEIKRITAAPDNAGPPETKKPTPNNRVVVISSNSNSNNQPKILNNSLQQPGRITTTATASGSKVQGTKYPPINPQTQVISNNKLYTLLKPGSSPKLYSVLKTEKNPNSSMQSPSPSSIEKHYILQQSQKYLQLKNQRLQNATKFLNASTSSSASAPHYVLPIKIKEEPVDSSSTADTTLATNSQTNTSSVPPPPMSSASEENKKIDDLVGGVRRKHCNCSKSQCLKLYCDCFANGEFCQDCTCRDCCNNLQNEDERQRAIKSCLDRNPSAFKPKITSSREQADMRLHNKGCNCKRSGCLKNYCECYEAKIPCSSNCKCVGCRNVEDRPDLDMDPIDPKIMASIANASANAQKRTYDKSHSGLPGGITIKTEKLSKEGGGKYSSDFMGAGLPSETSPDDKQQCNFITQEVIDATIQCMITQADECEKNGFPTYQTEKMVMEELGRCLVEIIDFSIRNTDNSYSQE